MAALFHITGEHIVTFCLVFGRQHGDRDVVGALLAGCVGDRHLEGVHSLLQTADLQKTWMSRLQCKYRKERQI